MQTVRRGQYVAFNLFIISLFPVAATFSHCKALKGCIDRIGESKQSLLILAIATTPTEANKKVFSKFRLHIERELAKIGYVKNRPATEQTFPVNSVKALTFGIVSRLFILFPSWQVRFVAILPSNIEQDIEFPILEQKSLHQKLTRKVAKKIKKINTKL